MKPMLPTFFSNLVKTKHNHLIVEVIKFGISRHITSDRTIKHNVAREFLGTLVTITLVCNKDESAKMVAKNHYLKMCGQTIIANHPIQLWVVFTWHKPLMIFVEWANPTRNSLKWSCSGKQWWFKTFYLKCLQAWLNFFIPPFQTTWVVFSIGHSRHCAQG